MSEGTPYVLGDDAPKTDPHDDRLDLAPFAEAISQTVAKMSAPNGYVIGLHGPWGSGKSTVLNFTAAYLCQYNKEHPRTQIVHIDFRPWLITGHHDLISSFFKILSESLTPRRGKFFRLYYRILRFFRGTTSTIGDTAATISMAVDPSGGVISGLAGNLTEKSLNSLLDRFLESPSLQKAYEKLKKQLRKSHNRFLVTIDDIDRLDEVDMVSVIRMVKSIGQLPNIVYLLSYDRDVVWKTLDRRARPDGSENATNTGIPAFAEKIIQQELELPRPSRHKLLGLLDQEVAFMLGRSENSIRWSFILSDGIHRWMRSPRDVVRLSNAVKFSWPALEGEIDPQDLLAIEGLRLFDAEAFNWIRDNRDFLFTDGRFKLALEVDSENVVKMLTQDIPEYKRSPVLSVVTQLFPQVAKWLNNQETLTTESHNALTRRRGIGCEAGYDTYFRLHPSPDAIPLGILEELVSTNADASAIEGILKGYLKKNDSRGVPMVSEILDELLARYTGSGAILPTQALLDALFRVGEEVIAIHRNMSILDLPPRAQIDLLVYSMLERWGLAAAGEHLNRAFEREESPAFLADIYVSRGRELGVFDRTSKERPCIVMQDFEALGKILISKIENALRHGTLADAPFYFDIVRSWAHLSDPNEAKAWLETGITDSGEFMAKLCIGLVAYTTSTERRRYEMHERPDPNFYDLDLLRLAGRQHLERGQLTEDEVGLITAVVSGSDQFLKSTEPSDVGNDAE